MKELRFKRTHDLGQLLGELEAVTGLAPVEQVVTYPGGRKLSERVAVFTVMSEGDEITVRVPEGTDERVVERVVAAHAPQAKEPPPDLNVLFDDLRTKVNGATTVAGLKAALLAYVAYEEGKYPSRKRKG